MFSNLRSARKGSARMIILSLVIFFLLSAVIGIVQALLGRNPPETGRRQPAGRVSPR